jgi:phospholipid/cholesterol/gamma-HCH transport system substrate-binding protein
MEPKVNYTVVGLFVIVLVAVAVTIAVWLGKGDYGTKYDRYYAYMRESVAGLSVNSSVKYRGVEVGRIADIRLNPENPEEVRLTLDIVRGTPIKQDTVAVLHTQGLTGFAIVDLTGGTRASPLLTAGTGGQYPVIKTGPSLLTRLEEAFSRVVGDQNVSSMVANLGNLAEDARGMVNEENRAALKQILNDLATVTHALAEHGKEVDHVMADAARASGHVATATQAIEEELPRLLRRLNSIAAALEKFTSDTEKTGHAVSTLLSEARPNLEQFSRQTLPETGLLIAELRRLTASLQRVAGELEQEPNALVVGRHQPRGPGE